MNKNGMRLAVAYVLIGSFFLCSCATTSGTKGIAGTMDSERPGLRLSAFIQGTQSSSGFTGIATRYSRYHEVPPIKPDPQPVPEQHTARISKGMDMEKQGKYAEAESIYREIIADLPTTPAPFARLAYTLQALGYGREACQMFRKFQALGGRYRTKFVPEEINALVVVGSPKDEKAMIQSTKRSYGLISSDGEVFIVHLQNPRDQVMIGANEYWLGVDSDARFDKKDWVPFLGRSYRNGGVSVTTRGVGFVDGTERLENGGQISVYLQGGWKTMEQKLPSLK